MEMKITNTQDAVQLSNQKWAIRKMLSRHFDILVSDDGIMINSTGCSIFVGDEIFTVKPSCGSPEEMSIDVALQLKSKYPELFL